MRRTYLSLQVSNLQATQDLAGLIAVADVFKGFRRILSGNIQEHLLPASASMALAYDTWNM